MRKSSGGRGREELHKRSFMRKRPNGNVASDFLGLCKVKGTEDGDLNEISLFYAILSYSFHVVK